MKLSPVYIELGQSSLKVLREDRGLEVPLDRTSNGRLTPECRQKISEQLQDFLQRKSWQPRIRAACAISASGVSLRRFSLPQAPAQETERLLRLQIESEFPLGPDQLAWGSRPLGHSAANGSPSKQDLLIAAVRKEVLDDYAEALGASGVNPQFTLAALARAELCPQPLSCAVLDIGRAQSELAIFEEGVPSTIRILPWGIDHCTRAASVDAAFDALAAAISSVWTGRKLYLSGSAENVAPQLARRLQAECELLKVTAGEGRSAAVLGLKRADESHGRDILLLRTPQQPSRGTTTAWTEPATRRWIIAAACLVAALFLLPYAEALLVHAPLSRKLAEAKKDEGRLAQIDRNMQFLQSLKQSQPPYMDALYLCSKSVPQGARLDSVTMNRRGDVSIRGSMRNGEQVLDFRSKLIASGFFASVTVEEQTPTQDRQKVNVRMTAQWKPFKDRVALSIGPTAEEIAKATNAPPAGGGPPGMPPGMTMPMPRGMPPMNP